MKKKRKMNKTRRMPRGIRWNRRVLYSLINMAWNMAASKSTITQLGVVCNPQSSNIIDSCENNQEESSFSMSK